MKLMKHPLHGRHNVYSPNEEAQMRLNGWVDAEPVAIEAPAVVVSEQSEVAPTEKRKPGRPKKQ